MGRNCGMVERAVLDWMKGSSCWSRPAGSGSLRRGDSNCLEVPALAAGLGREDSDLQLPLGAT